MPRSGPAGRRRLAVPLAAVQACLAAAGAAVPSLHLGAASHHHAYCPEHERFEDLAPSASPQAAPPARAPAVALAHRPERAHAACACSNLLLRPMLSGPSLRAPACGDAGLLEPASCAQAGHPPLATLLLAPKHSPPRRPAAATC